MQLGEYKGIGGLVKEAGGEFVINVLKNAKKSPGKMFGLIIGFGGACAGAGVAINKIVEGIIIRFNKEPKYCLELYINGELKKTYLISKSIQIKTNHNNSYEIIFTPLENGEQMSKFIRIEKDGIYSVVLKSLKSKKVTRYDYEAIEKMYINN